MLRQHQFEKVEMVSVTHPDKSDDEQKRMLRCAEGILEKLGIPYRTVILCTGDMGFGARRTYDIEAWLPGQNTYREISSVSTMRGFSGAPHECALPTRSRGQAGICAYPEWFGLGRWALPDSCVGEWPERGWDGHPARGSGALSGRQADPSKPTARWHKKKPAHSGAGSRSKKRVRRRSITSSPFSYLSSFRASCRTSSFVRLLIVLFLGVRLFSCRPSWTFLPFLDFSFTFSLALENTASISDFFLAAFLSLGLCFGLFLGLGLGSGLFCRSALLCRFTLGLGLFLAAAFAFGSVSRWLQWRSRFPLGRLAGGSAGAGFGLGLGTDAAGFRSRGLGHGLQLSCAIRVRTRRRDTGCRTKSSGLALADGFSGFVALCIQAPVASAGPTPRTSVTAVISRVLSLTPPDCIYTAYTFLTRAPMSRIRSGGYPLSARRWPAVRLGKWDKSFGVLVP